jgi:hypothetical protein
VVPVLDYGSRPIPKPWSVIKHEPWCCLSLTLGLGLDLGVGLGLELSLGLVYSLSLVLGLPLCLDWCMAGDNV